MTPRTFGQFEAGAESGTRFRNGKKGDDTEFVNFRASEGDGAEGIVRYVGERSGAQIMNDSVSDKLGGGGFSSSPRRTGGKLQSSCGCYLIQDCVVIQLFEQFLLACSLEVLLKLVSLMLY